MSANELNGKHHPGPRMEETDINFLKDALENLGQEVINHITTMYPDMWKAAANTENPAK